MRRPWPSAGCSTTPRVTSNGPGCCPRTCGSCSAPRSWGRPVLAPRNWLGPPDSSARPLLVAMAAQAEGACALAAGDGRTGMTHLRAAWAAWRDLDAPYESAQVRLLMAEAHRLLDDPGSAELELEAAGWVFHHLGAAPDLERVRALSSHGSPAGPLTGREVEELRLVATGMTNRAVAAETCSSVRGRSPDISATSSPNSGFRRERPRRRTPTSRAWSSSRRGERPAFEVPGYG